MTGAHVPLSVELAERESGKPVDAAEVFNQMVQLILGCGGVFCPILFIYRSRDWDICIQQKRFYLICHNLYPFVCVIENIAVKFAVRI